MLFLQADYAGRLKTIPRRFCDARQIAAASSHCTRCTAGQMVLRVRLGLAFVLLVVHVDNNR